MLVDASVDASVEDGVGSVEATNTHICVCVHVCVVATCVCDKVWCGRALRHITRISNASVSHALLVLLKAAPSTL